MIYLAHLIIYLSIYLIVTSSLNLIVGYCGLITLAHAGFFAVGSYVYALISIRLGWEFLPAVAASIIIAMVLSLCVSFPAARLRGNFFVLVSLTIQALLFGAFYNWASPGSELGTWRNLTNGAIGISAIPKPVLFGIVLYSSTAIAALAISLAISCIGLLWVLIHSPWGRLLQTIRDDELAALSIGKNTAIVKMQAIAIACGLVAISGALYAAYTSFIDPSMAALEESNLMLSMVVIGGVGNFRGPLISALILLIVPEILNTLHLPTAIAANLRLGIYGLLLVILMHLRPQGLFGRYQVE